MADEEAADDLKDDELGGIVADDLDFVDEEGDLPMEVAEHGKPIDINGDLMKGELVHGQNNEDHGQDDGFGVDAGDRELPVETMEKNPSILQSQ
ncbi:UNVERIFIED_CONTAM: hypothetical protein Sindi_0967500 [Sesamum indicum]